MNFSLRTKLSLSYVFVALLLVFLLSIFANLLFEKQFKDYIIKQQDQKNNDIVSMVKKQLTGTVWDRSEIENIGLSALEQGMILKVRDSKGNTIWDATLHNNGLCTNMIAHMAKNMNSRYHNFDGGYTEKSYNIMQGSKKTGSILIGYYGPFFYNDNDLAFINKLNEIIVGVGIFSLVIALLLGVFMARRLSNPISRVINTARQIEKGYFGDRIKERSSTKEIGQLTLTINNLAETMEKQETLRKHLTADVAHELRTPLATLQSHMEAMIDGIWEADKGRLSACHEEIIRLNRLVGDLEKLAKYESGNLIIDITEFDVYELIKRSVQNFESDYNNKGVNIEVCGETELIHADRDKINQLIVNLLSNALKYTPKGGTVLISVKGSYEQTEISVKDTGTGIGNDDMPYIFERFFRADKSRNRLTGGSGIGLAVVKAIVDAHRGTISVTSELEKGTEFVVILPRKSD